MSDEQVDIDLVRQIRNAMEESKLDFDQSGSFRLAVLRVEFTSIVLRADMQRIFGQTVSDLELEKLQENAEHNETRDTWSLFDNIRSEALPRLSITEISDLLQKMDFSGTDWRQQLLNRMLQNKVPDSGYLVPEEYVQAYVFSKWIRHPSIRIPSTEQLLTLIRRENLLNPFRKLTVNFSSRKHYLSLIKKFVMEPAAKDKDGSEKFLLFIRGVGGVGKSTVVSKFLIDEAGGQSGIPFGYVDFDSARVSASNFYALMTEVLTQLCLQVPSYESRFNAIIKEIYSLTNSKRLITKGGSRTADRRAFYMDFVNDKELELLKGLTIPVLIVFDSFEELQYRSTPFEIDTLFDFLREIKSFIPSLKVIFIGRADIIDKKRQEAGIPPLGEFEIDSAIAYLNVMKIADIELCQMIFNSFGGNPLNLQLAANLILREIPKEKISLAEVNKRGLFEKIDKKLIQQQLVARNLDHIHNKDVAAIAVPGVLVRKINAGVIKDVLAEVCGLGKISLEKAEEIFEELQKESFLLRQEGEDIQFRKDLRVSLYDLIIKEPKYNAFKIHNAAVNYYEHRDSPSDQAEYIFHRLKRGDDPEFLDKVYKPPMKPFLETTLSELPEDSREQLALFMGIETGNVELETISQERWELYLLAQMQNVLEVGDEKQLKEVGERLRKRKDRTGNPEFQYHELLIYIRLGESGRFENLINYWHLPPDDLIPITLVRFALLRSYRFELQFDFSNALEELEKVTSTIDRLNATEKDLKVIIEYYCNRARLSKRLGRKFDDRYWRLPIFHLASKTFGSSDFSTIDKILQLFPKIYQVPLIFQYSWEERDKNNNVSLLPRLSEVMPKDALGLFLLYIASDNFFISDRQFDENYKGLRLSISNRIELERFSRISGGVRLSDITYPGSLNVLLFDYVLFHEAMTENRKDRRLNTEKIHVDKDFKDGRNLAGVQEFINTAGVRTCLERLNREFSGASGRKLIVSDIIDDEGHQYVNIIQRSNGIHHIALLGYLYVLEKMGIRFLKSAGVKTGAINAALIGTVESKKEESVEKALGSILSLDYYKLVDASPPFLKFLIRYFSPGHGLKSRMKFLGVSILMIILSLFFLGLFYNKQVAVSEVGNTIWLGIAGYALILISWIYFSYTRFKRHVLAFGKGLNPGNFISAYFTHLFSERKINSISDLEERAKQKPPLRTRLENQFNVNLVDGDIAFLCADVISQKKIIFPQMSSLFWEASKQRSIDPGIFLRAAVSTPLFFDAVIIENIAGDNLEIKEAWLKYFNEYEPPAVACLVDAGPISVFPFDIFSSPIYNDFPEAPLPTFAADTLFSNEKLKVKSLKELKWSEYLSRIINSAPYNIDTDRANQDRHFEKGMCKISISNIAAMNFFCSDRDKIRLFTMGAEAATEFLLKFDWEDYKHSMNTGSALSL